MYRIELSEQAHTLMTNALRLARDEYAKLAKRLRAEIPGQEELEKANPDACYIMTADGARLVVEQFEQQARDTDDLIELLDEAEEIDLMPKPLMNMQAVFDAGCAALIKQGTPAWDRGTGQCAYRIPNHTGTGVNKCFVGQLIPDQSYSKTMEGVGLCGESDPTKAAKIRASLPFSFGRGLDRERRIDFLVSMQEAHDSPVFGGKSGEGWLREFVTKAAAVARGYGLDASILETVSV